MSGINNLTGVMMSSINGTLSQLNNTGNSIVSAGDYGNYPLDSIMSPDGKHYYVLNNANGVVLINLVEIL